MMDEMLNTDSFPEKFQIPGEESTVSLLVDPDSGSELPSPDELRSLFEISDGDDCRDYGELKLLGLGGMGAVFQAEDPALKRKVALKILRSNFRNRKASIEKFVREARITAKIDHPNIVAVHRLGVLENIGVYFTMKRINGKNLREILLKLAGNDPETCQHYTLRRLLEIFNSCCNAVAAAHDHGILHCDLKPGNIMVGNFGEVMVMDWGVAREKDQQQENVSGQTPQIEGTPVFMAPELINGQQNYPDEQTDVYGLGAILYTIITRGNLPFDVSKDQESVIMDIACGNIIPVKENIAAKAKFHSELAAIAAKAMAYDRSVRYKNVEELRQDIDNYLDGFPVSACSPTVLDRFFKLIRRRPLIPSVLLAIVLSWASYYGVNRLLSAAAEKTLQNIIADNTRRGNSNRQMVLIRYRRLQREKLSGPEREALQRNMLTSAVNASVEYNLVFDAASRLRIKEQEHFLRSGGSKLFSQMLRMHGMIGNRSLLRNTLSRCRGQWKELFDQACRLDPDLKALTKRLTLQMK